MDEHVRQLLLTVCARHDPHLRLRELCRLVRLDAVVGGHGRAAVDPHAVLQHGVGRLRRRVVAVVHLVLVGGGVGHAGHEVEALVPHPRAAVLLSSHRTRDTCKHKQNLIQSPEK